jgi:Fe-S-cluster-containing dehydrogenase component/formate-dependent nitrite reductase membrane component NrfD
MRLGKIIDNTRCIGCHACSTACKSENEVPIGVDRTRVKYVETGVFPNVRRHFQVTRCNQCDHPPCVYICPVTAMYQRSDGLVEFDKDACIGCRACMAACPYDAIYIDPEAHSAAKCHFCAHRIELDLQPACVVVCPEEAIIVGDLDDPTSVIARRLAREGAQVRKPELGTQPKLFYIGGSHATLRPEAAARPDADIFMWSSQRSDETVGRGAGNVASTILAYDTAHVIPWGTDVALYMWTKSVAAGALLVAALAALAGRFAGSSVMATWAPLLALLFLSVTGVLLIVDLEHPARFLRILTRPQWKSWLVRGAVILMAFGALAVLWLAPALLGPDVVPPMAYRWLALAAVPVSAAAAAYTAFLLAQATGRELWATPLAAPHLVVQALLAGSGALLMCATAMNAPLPGVASPDDMSWLRIVFLLSLVVHALFVAAELFVPHRSAHVARAVDTILSGKFAKEFWIVAVLVGVALPLLAALASGAAVAWALASALVLIGLFAWEYVWVFAGQSVPLS